MKKWKTEQSPLSKWKTEENCYQRCRYKCQNRRYTRSAASVAEQILFLLFRKYHQLATMSIQSCTAKHSLKLRTQTSSLKYCCKMIIWRLFRVRRSSITDRLRVSRIFKNLTQFNSLFLIIRESMIEAGLQRLLIMYKLDLLLRNLARRSKKLGFTITSK